MTASSKPTDYEMELADEVLYLMLSTRVDAIREEKNKANPDETAIQRLQQEIDFYNEERDAVIESDAATVRRVLDEYYPKIKDAYECYRAHAMSPAMRETRQKAVDYARASIGLEGLNVSPEEEQHALRYINGEIDHLTYMTAPHHGTA